MPKFQETSRLMTEPVPGIQAVPAEDNARYFQVAVAGPKDVRKNIISILLFWGCGLFFFFYILAGQLCRLVQCVIIISNV